jgi:List-Bact-rpt repeat protein/glycosyl hydrolase family 123/3-keto-disaccharide hydrolase
MSLPCKSAHTCARVETKVQARRAQHLVRAGWKVLWAAALIALALSAPAALWAQSVTAVTSSLKLRPSDRQPLVSSIEIHAAHNEFQAFQLVVSNSTTLSSVSVDPPTLTLDGSTTTIPASEVRLYREAYVVVNQASNAEGAYYAPGSGSRIPDALIPAQEDGAAMFNNAGTWSEGASTGETRNAFPFSLPANDNLIVWVEVHVPAGQTPGRYTGTVNVRNGGTVIGTMNVVLQVLNFNLNPTSQLAVAFGFAVDGVCRAHGDVDANGFCPSVSEIHKWARLYGRFFLDHRISISLPDDSNHTPTTSSIAAYNNDYASIINGTDGFQRLSGAQMTTIKYPWLHSCNEASVNKPGGCEDQATFTSKLQQWFNLTKDPSGSFGARTFNWFTRSYLYALPDEPNGTTTSCAPWTDAMQINDQATWAFGVDPNFPVMATASISEYQNCGAGSPLAIIDPVLDQMESPTSGNHRADYNTFLQTSGHQVWMYQSCDQDGCGTTTTDTAQNNWPSLVLDATGVQSRAEPWMHYIYSVPGMLFFDTTNQIDTAWNANGLWNPGTTSDADGTLVYAGTPGQIGGNSHIPIASYRLKMLRAGLQDYEYLQQCATATSSTNALSIAHSLFPAPGEMHEVNNYPNTPDPAGFASRMDTARQQLENCITGNTTVQGPNTVTVAPSGTGSGTVVSAPAGINCGTTCSASFPSGTSVTLTATPNSGSTFGGFSGACVSSSTTCTFTPTANSTVSAVFNLSTGSCNFTDCFDRANASTLGANWNTASPSIEIFSNQARASSTGTKAADYLSNVGPDQDISVDCQVAASGSNCGLLARFNDASNFYYAYLDGGQGSVAVFKEVGGTATLLGSASRTIAFNTYYRLRFLVQGSSLNLFFNNETSPAVSVTDASITTGNFGGLHAFAGAVSNVLWDNFNIQAAGPAALFTDDFNRTSGLGTNWQVWNGAYTTDGANAVSGTMTPSGTGNWASVVPAMNTNDYSVVASLAVPAGAPDSGVVARGNTANFTSDLYSAQISTAGAVNLFRRNAFNWTQLATFATPIQAGVSYSLKLLVSGSTTVHLEVWLNGTQVISFDDSSASRLTSGAPGIVNYNGNVLYDTFSVLPVSAPPPPPPTLFSDDFNRTTGLGTNWKPWDGGYTTDGANAVSGAMTPAGTGNWASVVPALNTNDYSVNANLAVPAGSEDSGIVARGNNTTDFTSDLYSAQISTTGAVNLYRRNAYAWTQLASFATTIQTNVSYNLKLIVSGSTTVHLEVWLNGTNVISFDDASASRITSGPPGIVNYDGNVKYDSFSVSALQ